MGPVVRNTDQVQSSRLVVSRLKSWWMRNQTNILPSSSTASVRRLERRLPVVQHSESRSRISRVLAVTSFKITYAHI